LLLLFESYDFQFKDKGERDRGVSSEARKSAVEFQLASRIITFTV